MTPEEVRAKKAKLDAKRKELDRKRDKLKLKYTHLQLDCAHPNKYGTNCMGRDPGGAYCPDCGKSW